MVQLITSVLDDSFIKFKLLVFWLQVYTLTFTNLSFISVCLHANAAGLNELGKNIA